MDVTPQELRGSEIKEAFRGFNRDEVDDLLERAAATIENLTRQVEELESRPPADPAALPSNRDDAEILQRTLLLAQRAADDAVNEAQAHARKLIEESEARAQALVGEAESTARRIAEGERRRLEEEISDLSTRRDQLSVDADALDEYVSGYRDRVRAAIEADLERIGTPVIEPPSARPELHEVELPPERFDRASRAERPTEREPEPAASSAIAPDMFPEPEPEPRLARSSFADPPRPRETEWPPPADTSSADASAPEPSWAEASWAETSSGEGSAAGASSASVAAPPREEFAAPAAQAASSWHSEVEHPVDVAQGDEPASWDHRTAEHEPFPVDTPVEAKAVDGGGDLDDDAFFASLREAVADEAPLGPREEQKPFFDDDPVEERRGHFRRRR
jgi:cell division initiation protein